MKKIIHVLLFMVVFTVMNACRKDPSDDSAIPVTTTGTHIQAIISGMVLDESNNAMQGVSVSAYGLTSVTDQYGIFNLQGSVDKNRCVMKLTKAGFLDRTHAIIPKQGTLNYVRIVMSTEPVLQNISSGAGGSIAMNGGASVDFLPNSFVNAGTSTPYTGIVNVSAKLHGAMENPWTRASARC